MKIFSHATRRPVIHTALITSAIVGTILNLYNQFPHLLTHTALSPVKVALNYVTPYIVATVGAVRMCCQFDEKKQKIENPENPLSD